GIHFHGPTGRFKSEFAALLQQHYGAGLDARNFPANWMSTANALEEQAFLSKDVLIACDDFNPTGAVDPQKLHAVADRLFRGAGNHAGRGRMNADRSLAAPRPARGLILSTGEDLMKGHSCRARVIMIEVRPGDVSKSRLTACQADARAGLYATSMSAYVQWLAPRITEIRKGLPAERAALREQFLAGAPHARTPAAAADLMIGLSYLTRFAVEVNAITGVEARRLLDRGKAAVLELVAEQTDSLQAADPVNQFLELLPAVLTSGQAHLSDPKGWAPAPEQAHGWQHDGTNWKPRGVRIGWAEGDDIYLSPDAAFAEVQKLASTQREPITMSATTLWKRLHQRNLLAQVDDRGGRTRFAVRKTLGGEQVQVLCFKRCVFFPPKATGWGEDGGQGGQNEGNAQENERFTTATQPNGCGHVATGGGHLWEGNPEGTGHRGGQPGSGVQGGGQCEKPTLLNGSATNGHHGHTADPRNGRPSANGTARRNPPDAR
ncbi:MAG TPA: hypothetical protein VKE74_31690, partial [Gemmataceae bacterium]|nr:hypothetical protein [Gemmataceae bacterium]